MVSASSMKLAKSSLEEMLESIRQRNHESEKPKDLPPILPSRPNTRRRLPSSRRSLPSGFKIDASGTLTMGKCDKRDADGNGEEKDVDSMTTVNASKGEKARSTVNDDHTFGYCISKVTLKDVHQVGDMGYTEKNVWQHIINVQKNFRGSSAQKYFWKLKRGAVIMQAFLRAHLVRINMKSTSRSNSTNLLAMQGIQQDDHHAKVLPSTLPDLQRRVFKVEAALEQKEEENALLKEQLREFRERCMKTDVNMQSMEEVCQKQITSLHVSVATSTKSLAPTVANRATTHPDGNKNSVNTLDKEFDPRNQKFEGDAKTLMAVRRRHSNLQEVLRTLKHKIGSRKHDYRTRLREARIKLHKLRAFECRPRRNIS